jgi:hypothetical protein
MSIRVLKNAPLHICSPYFFFTWTIIIISFIILSGVRLSPLGTATTPGLLYQPQKIDDGDCGAVGGMAIGRVTRSTGRKPAPAQLCPSHIPHEQTRAQTRAAAVGSQRITAWAMARPQTPTMLVSGNAVYSLNIYFIFILELFNADFISSGHIAPADGMVSE